jgi:NAD(P)-dependent dehydrogenase (short-subunit alcohol dehydrogenase family)
LQERLEARSAALREWVGGAVRSIFCRARTPIRSVDGPIRSPLNGHPLKDAEIDPAQMIDVRRSGQAYLASAKARYIAGSALTVDGGAIA